MSAFTHDEHLQKAAHEGGACTCESAQAQGARHDVALKVQGAWSGGYKRLVEMGGSIFVVSRP